MLKRQARFTLIDYCHLTPSCRRAPPYRGDAWTGNDALESLTPRPELENSQGHLTSEVWLAGQTATLQMRFVAGKPATRLLCAPCRLLIFGHIGLRGHRSNLTQLP